MLSYILYINIYNEYIFSFNLKLLRTLFRQRLMWWVTACNYWWALGRILLPKLLFPRSQSRQVLFLQCKPFLGLFNNNLETAANEESCWLQNMKRKVLIFFFFNKKEKSFHESSADIWGNFQKSLLKRKDVCMCSLSDCPSKNNFFPLLFLLCSIFPGGEVSLPSLPKWEEKGREMMVVFLPFLKKFLFHHYPPAITLNCLHALYSTQKTCLQHSVS